MAGIGIKLNRIYGKNTITTNMFGFFYSTVVTIAPMFLVIATILLMGRTLGLPQVGYALRELFACTVLYIFVFSLLTAAPFNAVLSKYMSDVIYEERYEDILPCFYIGLLLNVGLGVLIGVPFCIWEYLVGKVEIFYIFTGFGGYISLVLVFYSMLYLSICKDYQKISGFFLIGMAVAFCLSVLMVFGFGWEITYGMLFSLVAGFLLIACLELAVVQRYFKKSSNQYRRVFQYFWNYRKLVATNFLYILGLYLHNFVFWTTDLRMVVAKSFVCAPAYDMATCLAMFTNISATIIFISRVEMYFHERYKAYSEAVIGGRRADIENTKKRMFGQLAGELMNLARIQFIVTVVLYLACIVLLPRYGFAGLVMQIYPCLAAGYFILFVMYSAIIFLYYFDDLTGALLTAVSFCAGTLAGSLFSSHLPEIWYGAGLLFGAFLGWVVAYFRLRWVERNMDVHVFCRGTILKLGKGKMPGSKVYDAYQLSRISGQEKGEGTWK